jgi:hypothetical protein
MASPEDLDRVIAASVEDPDERAASRVLARALGERAGALAGGGLPTEHREVSERILAEARIRSARIAGEGVPVSAAEYRGIPWWLWMGWGVAIVGAILAWHRWG